MDEVRLCQEGSTGGQKGQEQAALEDAGSARCHDSGGSRGRIGRSGCRGSHHDGSLGGLGRVRGSDEGGGVVVGDRAGADDAGGVVDGVVSGGRGGAGRRVRLRGPSRSAGGGVGAGRAVLGDGDGLDLRQGRRRCAVRGVLGRHRGGAGGQHSQEALGKHGVLRYRRRIMAIGINGEQDES